MANFKGDAARGVDTLRKLTAPGEDGKPKMPKSAVKESQAIAVLRQEKMGFAVGMTFGGGYVVKRLGPNKWSAPSYLELQSASLGVTFGAKFVDSILCIKDEAALEKLLGVGLILGTDVQLQWKSELTEADNSVGMATDAISIFGPGRGAGVVSFSLEDGAGFDLSLKGGLMKTDEDANKEAFGADATPAKILSGEIPPPPEFGVLYDALSELDA